jgi:UDP-GlcNAc:undecaprenyl-phosphate GlcNAc-1-phosphate transferase
MLPLTDMLILTLLSGVISLGLVAPIERLCCLFLIVDHPSERRLHSQPVTRAGGVIIVLTLVISLTIIKLTHADLLDSSFSYHNFLLLSSVVVLLGLIDDRFELEWKTKLFFQILICLFVCLHPSFIGISTVNVFERFNLFFFYLVLMNAINLIDGLNGLCIFISTISLLGLLSLSHSELFGNTGLMIVIPLFIGALLGIARSNFKSPRIFLGDSGSMLIGFSLTTFFILTAQSGNFGTKDQYIIYILIFGLPLIELISTCIRRIAYSRGVGRGIVKSLLSIVVADTNHLHHQLLAKNYSLPKTLSILCLLHCICIIPIFIFYFIH